MNGNHFQEATMRGRSLEMRTTLALLCCLWSDGLPRLDRGVAQTIAALNQVFQPLGEACCRSAIEHLVIKTDRQTEIVPDSYVPVNDTRLLANAARRNRECVFGGWRDTPTCPFPKHAHCR